MGFDYRTSTGLGKQTHGGHKQKPVHTRTQEKVAVTTQETDPDSPVSAQGLPDMARVSCGLLQCWGHWDLLKEVAIVFITSTIVWSQVKQQGGPQSHPSTESPVEWAFNIHKVQAFLSKQQLISWSLLGVVIKKEFITG